MNKQLLPAEKISLSEGDERSRGRFTSGLYTESMRSGGMYGRLVMQKLKLVTLKVNKPQFIL